MLKRSFAITMAVGALAVGGGAASALADSGDTGSTTTGTTTMTDTPTTVATTVATPVTVTTAVKGDDVAEHAANDVMAAANGVQNEAIAATDDDDTGDRHGANDDSEESWRPRPSPWPGQWRERQRPWRQRPQRPRP